MEKSQEIGLIKAVQYQVSYSVGVKLFGSLVAFFANSLSGVVSAETSIFEILPSTS